MCSAVCRLDLNESDCQHASGKIIGKVTGRSRRQRNGSRSGHPVRPRRDRSSESVLRQFCGQCGSSLFWSRSRGDYADWISIALGTLDTVLTWKAIQRDCARKE
ncbi:GFA family protein [Pseudomonas fluorescens]|uniref:GFA family protein n=1 Tax=Pseudomonas fluorescens TaxID=294 RepID=UPI001CD295A3|nr:GFA family protein [Pseudomonas fluorescens]